MNFCYDFTMKSAQKSRNISRRKMRPSVLQRGWQEEILRDWLNYLLDPAFSTTVRPSDANRRLGTVRREIARLKKIDGCFFDEDGSLHASRAVAHLEEEERHLLTEKRSRTYQCVYYFGRTAPKGLGNIEEAERSGVSALIVRSLKPRENAYDVLQKELAARKGYVGSKAIQMRVRRLEKKIQTGHLTWFQILQYHYRCYKYFVGSNLWLDRFKSIPPVGYLRKCLTLTRPEMNMLRSLVPVPKSPKV
jgi:hypothetical protein